MGAPRGIEGSHFPLQPLVPVRFRAVKGGRRVSYGLVVSTARTVVDGLSLPVGTANASLSSCRKRSVERCRKRMVAMLRIICEIDND